MATNKTYTVVKDGETLKELKALAAAKKLADTEGAEVYCDGTLVYETAVNEPVTEDEPELIPEPETTPTANYKLTARMNIRKSPSKEAEKLGVAEVGTVVTVSAVEGDWLHLTNGTFILFEGGRFAEKL
jgi:hypothetical protein